MGGRPITRRQIATVALFTLSCFSLILFVWISFGGRVPLAAHGYRFHAIFAQAPNLAVNEDVRIAGVPVGKVVSVTPLGGQTDAVLELKSQYAPLPSDARVLLRSKTLLGENFVDLAPGARTGAKLKENAYLATANVDVTQQIDQVLGAFDPPTRAAFKHVLAEIGSGLRGRGGDLNAALGNTGPAVDSLNQVVSILDQQGSDLTKLIHDTGAAFQAVGSRSGDVQTLVTAGNQVLSATAARDRQLTATIRALPGFLGQLRPTLSALDTTAGYAAPTLHAVRPVAPLVAPALRYTNALTPKLTALFHRLNPIIDVARRAVPATVDLLHTLDPLSRALDPALRQLVPVVQYLDRYKREGLTTGAGTGAATEATLTLPSGQRQHYARVAFPLNDQLLVGQSLVGPDSRHNAYPAPGFLDKLATGLEALDCNNTSNPPAALSALNINGTVPCVVQTPWTFQSLTQEYPHVQEFKPQP